MWVRVATFEGGDTEKLDKLMDERMSSGEMPPPGGMSSVLILDDKDAKKRKFLAFFDSHDTLEAAEAGFDQQGDVIPEEIQLIQAKLEITVKMRARGKNSGGVMLW